MTSQKPIVTLVFSSSDYFVPYLSVALISLCQHIQEKHTYHVYVLEREITDEHKTMLYQILKPYGVRLFFKDVGAVLTGKNFKSYHHVSVETFFKLLIPVLFNSFNRILFCDADIVFQDDPAKLFFTDLKGKKIGAGLCHLWHAVIQTNKKNRKYTKKILGLQDPDTYFQAGVVLFDLKKITSFDIERSFELAEKRFYSCMDQDVLNMCFQNQVFYFDSSWNYETPQRGFLSKIPHMRQDRLSEWKTAGLDPKIIHYSGENKPWLDPMEAYAGIWWRYARQSPFYEQIISRMVDWETKRNIRNNRIKFLRDFTSYYRYKGKYIWYRTMEYTAFSRKNRIAFHKKAINLKKQLKSIRRFAHKCLSEEFNLH